VSSQGIVLACSRIRQESPDRALMRLRQTQPAPNR
jgi:hypothetical protein